MLRQTKAGDIGTWRAGQCRFCWHQDAPLAWLLRELMATSCLERMRCRRAQSLPRQGAAEGHGGARPRAFRRSSCRRHGRAPGGRVSTESRGTTPCNFLCPGHRNAEPELGAVNRAKRQRCGTVAAGCTAEPRQARRRVSKNALKHGRYAADAIARRRETSALVRAMRALARTTRELE